MNHFTFVSFGWPLRARKLGASSLSKCGGLRTLDHNELSAGHKTASGHGAKHKTSLSIVTIITACNERMAFVCLRRQEKTIYLVTQFLITIRPLSDETHKQINKPKKNNNFGTFMETFNS